MPYKTRFLFALLLAGACTHHIQPAQHMQHIKIPFESNPNQTMHYEEIIDCYQRLAAAFPDKLQFEAVGSTDIGQPLHVAVLSTSGVFDPIALRKANKRIVFINNGIHPGEPEGIDATFMLLRDILESPERQQVLKNQVLVVIPVYNVDGCINRNSFTRANQDGPESYGFRGNARNFDLNRDFVKCDTRNAQTFNQIFSTWRPDVFVDNHTSNGADYQYVMTLIATQHNKLEAPLGDFLDKTMVPALYADMKQRGWDMTPYVESTGETPDTGILGFCDYARYSTGYAALWNTIGFMPETHMLKPFADRVKGTYDFMQTILAFVDTHGDALAQARAQAQERTRSKSAFDLDWTLDQKMHDSITFKGYAAKYKPSEVSGLPRLWYDRSEPWERKSPYYNSFKPTLTVTKPKAYVIPQAWQEVIERLRLNGVVMETLKQDTELETETYFIGDFKTRNAWEGHYYHSGVQIERKKLKRKFFKGDFLIYTNQDANRYLVETLEPQGPDSWFAWNFFESILMQKEYFSAYVFEDLAAQFLKDNPAVKKELDDKRAADPAFAADADKQLDWVYRKSPWYEPTHRMYPIARITN